MYPANTAQQVPDNRLAGSQGRHICISVLALVVDMVCRKYHNIVWLVSQYLYKSTFKFVTREKKNVNKKYMASPEETDQYRSSL